MSDTPIQLPSPFALQCPVLICLEVWLMDYARTAIVPQPNTFAFTDSFGTVHAVSFDKDGYAAIPDVSAGPGYLVYKGTPEELAEACGYPSKMKAPAAREQNKLSSRPHVFAVQRNPQNADTYGHRITYPVLRKGKGISLWVDIRAVPCTRHVIEILAHPCRWKFSDISGDPTPVHFAITNTDGLHFSTSSPLGSQSPHEFSDKMRKALAKPWPPKNPKDYAELCSNISGTKRLPGASDFFHLLHSINKGVNEFVKYTSEPVGQEDDWQVPEKTLRTQKGDCEDYALLKYALLHERGVPEENMRILAHRVKGIGHAILLVYDREGDTWYRLDNYEPEVLEKCNKFKGVGYDPGNIMALVCKAYVQQLREQ